MSIRFNSFAIAGCITAGVLSTVLLLVANPRHALAAGETYTWTGLQTIRASGGSLTAPVNLNEVGFSTVPGSGNEDFSGEFILSKLDPSGADCYVDINVRIGATTQSGNMAAQVIPVLSSPGTPITPGCPANVVQSYNQTIPIGGARPSSGSETHGQQAIDVRAFIGVPPAKAPANTTVRVTGSNKIAAGSPLVLQRQAVPGDSASTQYVGTLYLPPGTYTICISQPAACQSVTKVKFTPTGVTFGEAANDRTITANITLTTIGAIQAVHYDSQLVVLKSSDGTVVKSAQTNPFDFTPSSSSQQAAGAATQTVDAKLSAILQNVDPGTYQVCIDSLGTCKTVTKLKGQALSVDLSGDGTSVANGGNGNGQGPTPSCKTTGDAMAWIMCSIIDGLANTVDGIYQNVVLPMLQTPSLGPNDTSQGKHLYAAWSSFRIYADLFLIIALLVIVFGQSIGGGLVDAYTAKKVLPRLLAAAILINLSYFIVTIAVDITNVIGVGISNLILAPFGLNQAFDLSTLSSGAKATAGTIGLGLGGAGGVVAASFLIGAGSVSAAAGAALSLVWSFVLLPGLLIFIAIMCTLIIRLGLIFGLVIFAPVAFALYALPNTEQYFRRWWDLLYRTLLVFPIISVMFAISKVMAQSVIWSVGGKGVYGGFAYILALLIMILPLAGIPFAFKLAGGIIGRIHDFAKGATGKLSQSGFMKRGRENAAANAMRMRQGGSAKTLNSIDRSALGRGLHRIPVAGSALRSSAARAQERVSMLGTETLKDPRLAPIANDEWALKAAMAGSHGAAMDLLMNRYGRTRDQAEADISRFAATGLGWSQSSQIAAFQAGVADGTVFKDNKEQGSFIASIAGQNDALRDRIWGSAYAGNKSAGRYELSSSYSTGQRLVERLAYGGQNAVADYEWDQAAVEGGRNTSNTELSRLKGMGMDNLTGALTRSIERDSQLVEVSAQRAADVNLTVEQRQEAEVAGREAEQRLVQSVAKVENMRDAGMYSPEALITKLDTQTIRRVRPQIDAVLAQTKQETAARDAAGGVIYGPPQGPPLTAPNPDYSPSVAQEYDTQRQGGYSGRIPPGTPGGPGDPGAAPPPDAPGPH